MQIENYNETHKDASISLLSQNKDATYSEKKKIIWEWQYNENPFKSDFPSGAVIQDSGKIVGFNGYMPIELFYNNELIQSIWSVDTIIAPECRGKNFGGKLVDFVKKSAPIVIGLGISDTQSYIMRKHKYNANTDIEKYSYVCKALTIKDIAKKIIQYFYLLKKLIYRSNTKKFIISVIDAENSPKHIDLLWDKVKFSYKKTINRNYLYIHWKYGKHPTNKYKLIIINENEAIVAVGVFRKSNSTSRLLDYIGPSNRLDIKQSIIAVFKNYCSGSHMLECTTTDNEFKIILNRYGFMKYNSRPKFYIYSNVVEDNTPHMNWFIMGGDSDDDLCCFE